MSVEIEFPVEFIVEGTPVSLQIKNKKAKDEWKELIRESSYSSLPEGHFCTDSEVSVTLFYFPDTPMQGDIDNIVKPILDSLCKHVYFDDRQVERVLVQKFEPGKGKTFSNVSKVLSDAISGQRPLLFIKINNKYIEDTY